MNNNYITNYELLLKSLDASPNPSELVSIHASPKTKKLFSFLKSIYGRKFLSGQQYLQREDLEDKIYKRYTGKLPAVRGYDLMDMDKEKGDDQLNRAIYWGKKGAIITFCWHWYAPDDLNNPDCVWSFYSNRTDYQNTTSFSLVKAVTIGTPEYEFIISRIDKAAEMLRQLEKENIPVLWRPLHEANGSWFWWGNAGNDNGKSIEAYKKLWYIIFDRFENLHKLSNLIWVWNGQSKDLAVNPNTYDIAGEDIYSEKAHDHSSQLEKFNEVGSYTHGKLLTLSECGFIPHPDEMLRDNVKWLWWLPWWGKFVYKRDESFKPLFENDIPIINNDYMTPEFINEVFSHPSVICYEDLDWSLND